MLLTYLKGISAIAFGIFSFGIAAPFLISQSDDLAVVLGFGVIVVSIPIIVWLGVSIFKDVKKKLVGSN